jgi:hypothetical protein
MRRLFRNNGLSIAMFSLFLMAVCGQSLAGFRDYNDDQKDHGQPTLGFGEYLTTGHFIESIFENWESEFLQMASYVFLTAFLYQKGSPESKDPDDEASAEVEAPKPRTQKNVPWPVRRGGFFLAVYERSLSIALFLLFLASFALHAVGGARLYSHEQALHGGAAVSTFQYLGTSRFWFESFQNWQSEFLSVGVLVVFSIFLRQKGSPESKRVESPHSQTGSD